ncbi:unnamed protein product [Haemonchus placei]|uniref:MFS domain-containing protein n=1 Tax=Haemonchus placei TaxID=6290 RepID=A0A0N4VSQ4_HAEPC|nr:unnamed protein product [Haemonchus placei]
MLSDCSRFYNQLFQGTMQGIMLMSGSLARTLGPLLVSSLFQVNGPVPVWSIEVLCFPNVFSDVL